MSTGATILIGIHTELGPCYAAIDPFVRFTEPAVRESRLGALLAPYKSEEAAREALQAAGCQPGMIEPYNGAR